jgi:glycosyltransferase involved in cell wall biosynthesis
MLPPLDPAQPSYGYRPATTGDPAAPAVSIITAYDNAGALFLETVRSVLRQSLQQWEWLVVNDGSDEPAALRALIPLRSADGRIRVLDQPRRGTPTAWNVGVAASRAPLLFFLAADALLAPTALEQLAWTLASHRQSAFAGGWRIVCGRACVTQAQGFDTRHAFLHENTASAQSMIRRAVFEQVGGFDESRAPELASYEFWLRCAAQGLWGHDIAEYLIWLRDQPPRAQPNQRALRHELRERYPQLYRAGLPRLARGGGILDAHALIQTELPFQNLLRPIGKRRVLLLLPWIQVGGADRFALDLVAGLTARGDRVSVCLVRDMQHTWLDELRRVGCDVFNLLAFLDPADYPRFLHYLIDARQITTVLMSNSLLAYQLLPYLRAHCPHVAFVDYLHAEEPWRNGGFPRASVDHDGLLDLHIVSSQHLRRWMIAEGAAPEAIEVCTINVDAERWQPAPALRASVRAELGIADDLPLLLFVGRLAPEKRPQFLAEVLRLLHRSGTPFRCLLVGDGEDRAWLRYLIYRDGLGKQVRLLGSLPPPRVHALMAASDLLLLPSDREGIALTLYEALATGAVPVAADVGGQRELVTPECGVLIAHGPDEAARYVAAIQRLIADPTLRSRMAQAGRQRILAHFTAAQMLDRMQALLDQAVARVHTTPHPPISRDVGRAMAALAIEHYQLEAHLRALPAARPILALRQSYGWKLLGRLRGQRARLDRLRRGVYALRRALFPRRK